jgi:RNA polymerase sigma-70 factor (ECF subfamily)
MKLFEEKSSLMRRNNCKKPTDSEDFELIRSFVAGDRSAFNALALKYKDPVFNLCYRMTNNYHDADDCSQEAFIKAFRHLCKFKFKASFSTWIYRIAINTCKDRLSSLEYRHRMRFVELDKPIYADEPASSWELPEKAPSPVEELINKENTSTILQAIATLPTPQRVLVVLYDLEGKSYEEMAQIAGCPIGTIKSRLARARRELRHKLEGVIRDEV